MRRVEALLGDELLEIVESGLFLRCKMPNVAHQTSLSGGGRGRRRAMLFWRNAIHVEIGGC